MATVITISESGKVTVETKGHGHDHVSPVPATHRELARVLHILLQRADRTDQLLKVLDAKVEAIHRLVRVPTKLLVCIGTPYQEGT